LGGNQKLHQTLPLGYPWVVLKVHHHSCQRIKVPIWCI
jgi:hypothetical protein